MFEAAFLYIDQADDPLHHRCWLQQQRHYYLPIHSINFTLAIAAETLFVGPSVFTGYSLSTSYE